MMTLKKASLLATVGLMLAPAAFAAEGFQNVVKDTNGHIVKNTFNNCVVSNFTSATNECTGEVAISKELLTVYFDFNKSTLNSKEKAKLDKLVKLIKQAKTIGTVDIAGYADSIGKDGYNKKLSSKRAASVKAYLARKGLKIRKVTVEALGETQPVTTCDDTLAKPELIICLAEDRRVEIKLNMKK